MASRGKTSVVAAAPLRLQRSLNAPSKASYFSCEHPRGLSAPLLLRESLVSDHIEFLRSICGWSISGLQAKRCQAVIVAMLTAARCSTTPASCTQCGLSQIELPHIDNELNKPHEAVTGRGTENVPATAEGNGGAIFLAAAFRFRCESAQATGTGLLRDVPKKVGC